MPPRYLNVIPLAWGRTICQGAIQRYKTTEIIESVQQDGYGIGIVHM
jgi:hypothetical protein